MHLQTLINIIIRDTLTLIWDKNFLINSRLKDTDFTRNRKMPFGNLLIFLLCHQRRSLQAETAVILKKFHKKLKMVSPQAVSQARQKVKADAFKTIFELSLKTIVKYSKMQTFKNYRIHAVDGTNGSLPDTEENREIFGVQGNDKADKPMAGISIIYDVLNDLVINCHMGHTRTGERETLQTLINQTSETLVGEKRIILLDRGYPSREIYHFLENSGYKYIIRLIKDSYNFLEEMVGYDSIIHDPVDPHLIHRVIKITHDESERLLITNIFDEDFNYNDFNLLYQMRWSIESKYDELKNQLNLTLFTGNISNSMLQDFYITMFLANLTSLFRKGGAKIREDAQKLKPNENKHQYSICRNTTNKLVYEYLPTFMVNALEEIDIVEVFEILSSRCMPIRPGRKFKRKREHASKKVSRNLK